MSTPARVCFVSGVVLGRFGVLEDRSAMRDVLCGRRDAMTACGWAIESFIGTCSSVFLLYDRRGNDSPFVAWTGVS